MNWTPRGRSPASRPASLGTTWRGIFEMLRDLAWACGLILRSLFWLACYPVHRAIKRARTALAVREADRAFRQGYALRGSDALEELYLRHPRKLESHIVGVVTRAFAEAKGLRPPPWRFFENNGDL